MTRPAAPLLVAVLAIAVALLSVFQLERERAGLVVERLDVAGTPVTLLRPDVERPLPLVVVAHGFAGSRQMMRAISTTMARSGFAVASVDLLGHGRHQRPMTGDVTRLDGATARLVDQVVATTNVLVAQGYGVGPVSLVGHSMATDVVVRAAERLDSVGAVVAISMYSEAVTETSPARLLVVSGAQETRLRGNALEAVRMVDASAEEGRTVATMGVVRRAVAAPWVGHVGVLYAPSTLDEMRRWIAGADMRPVATPTATGIWVGLLLGAVIALAWPMAAALGPVQRAGPVPRKLAWLAVVAPVLPALGAAVLVPDGALGLTAFTRIAAFLGVWGLVQGAVLWWGGVRLQGARLVPALLLTGWGLGLFAFALDRYGGAFLPSGLRLWVMVLLLPAALVFTLADAALTRGAGLLLRAVARILPLAGLLGAMALQPLMGVAFTVVPVMVLFWLVYGLAGRWVAARAGHGTSGLVLGVILAWALAASTPLIGMQGV